ncbi:MAG: thiolase [Chloroflexi bacterium]|nr:thiolase [Chloroflexota bacterium]
MPQRRGRGDQRIAIVGVEESDQIGLTPNKSALAHHAEAAHNALADAGLQKKDVDGLFTAGPYSTLVTGEYLGIQPRYTDSTSVGGSSFVIHVAHAMAAIQAGFCEVALITHGETGRSSRAPAPGNANLPQAQYETPYGLVGPPISYALACRRYMHEFGEERTRQAMAEIAVSTRKWAQLNPKAMMRDPMTFDDYHNSRWIAWPFHLMDCCLVTDAGGAVVVTTAERAASCRKKPVWVQGAAEGHDHGMISAMPSFTSLIARETGKRALGMAGITHSDLDLTMVYDSFTYTVLLSLEDLGFCKKGEGPDFVKGQRTAPGGDFPLNASGGGLSYTHSGMYGVFLLIEAVRQLRGECGQRQVKAKKDPSQHAKTVLCNGTGGSLSSCGTVVLTRD